MKRPHEINFVAAKVSTVPANICVCPMGDGAGFRCGQVGGLLKPSALCSPLPVSPVRDHFLQAFDFMDCRPDVVLCPGCQQVQVFHSEKFAKCGGVN